MIDAISLVIAVLTLSFAQIYIWSKFYNCKIKFKNIWLYISLFLMTLSGIFGAMFVNAFIKMIILSGLLCVCSFLIFRRKFNETLLCTIFSHLLLTIADVISVLILILLLNVDAESIKNNYFLTSFGNILVAIIFVIICNIPLIRKIYLRLLLIINNFKVKFVLVFYALMIISINILMAIIYYKINSIFVIAINSLLLIVYSYIVYRSLNEKNDNIMIRAENDSLMENLNEYENMLDRQRIDNHENKNQLLIIKNMINKNDDNVIKYIDTIVKDEKEDDEVLYTKVKKIPSGGLQGIIYQKMLSMKDKNINFSIDVSRDVRKINLDNLNMSDNYKLCKIIGVLLDNAIEESLKITDKLIMISLYVDEEMLIIDISNKFNGKIDLDSIDNEGYTTKGDGHGYGLSLVKKLVSESELFINERKITNDIFKQVIKVKIK